MTENQENHLKEKLLEEYKRYRINLEIILAIRHLIKENDLNVEIIPPERKIIIKNNPNPKPPDLILKKDEREFVINEIKTTLSPGFDNVNQINNYLKAKFILDGDGNKIKIQDFSVNLIVSIESYSDVKPFFFSEINEILKEKFSITTYYYEESIPNNGVKYYIFEIRDNRTIFENFNNVLNVGNKIYQVDWQKEGEEVYFINTPPVQYTITILWTIIFSYVKNDEDHILFNKTEKVMQNYYCKWNESRDYYKRDWLRKAFDTLIEFDMLEKIDKEQYKITKSLNKDEITEIMCKKLAEKKINEESKPEREINKEGNSQAKLDQFWKNV